MPPTTSLPRRMEPIGKKPCIYAKNGCMWKTPTSHLITMREDNEANMRVHSSECLHNPLVRENRQ